MNWTKIDRTVNSEGTTITYAAEGTGRQLLVQSRLRHIPHSVRPGTWDKTFYYIIICGQEVPHQYGTLKDAKEVAETLWQEECR